MSQQISKLVPKPGPRIEADTPIETVRTSSNPLRPILEGLECGQRYVDNFKARPDAVRFTGKCRTAAEQIKGKRYAAITVRLADGYLAGIRRLENEAKS